MLAYVVRCTQSVLGTVYVRSQDKSLRKVKSQFDQFRFHYTIIPVCALQHLRSVYDRVKCPNHLPGIRFKMNRLSDSGPSISSAEYMNSGLRKAIRKTLRDILCHWYLNTTEQSANIWQLRRGLIKWLHWSTRCNLFSH